MFKKHIKSLSPELSKIQRRGLLEWRHLPELYFYLYLLKNADKFGLNQIYTDYIKLIDETLGHPAWKPDGFRECDFFLNEVIIAGYLDNEINAEGQKYIKNLFHVLYETYRMFHFLSSRNKPPYKNCFKYYIVKQLCDFLKDNNFIISWGSGGTPCKYKIFYKDVVPPLENIVEGRIEYFDSEYTITPEKGRHKTIYLRGEDNINFEHSKKHPIQVYKNTAARIMKELIDAPSKSQSRKKCHFCDPTQADLDRLKNKKAKTTHRNIKRTACSDCKKIFDFLYEKHKGTVNEREKRHIKETVENVYDYSDISKTKQDRIRKIIQMLRDVNGNLNPNFAKITDFIVRTYQ